ncbi:MAG: DinB family protein [Thermoanaerobaculia bacterium]|nr:DinB family protein [Thermoanaerobaculia bacterium]
MSVNGEDPLAIVEAELNEATDRARRMIEACDPRRFTVRPDPARWSAAECIAHLSVSSEMVLPVLREALEHGKRSGITGGRPPSMDLLGRVLRWFLEPPVRSRLKTAAPFVPRSVRAKAESLAEFSAFQSKLIEALKSARGLDLGKLKVVSPFDKRMKFNLYSAFRIVAAHERRHLWQAEQAIEALAKMHSPWPRTD